MSEQLYLEYAAKMAAAIRGYENNRGSYSKDSDILKALREEAIMYATAATAVATGKGVVGESADGN